MDFLHALESRLARSGQLCGSVRMMTDAAIVPFVRQFAAVDAPYFDNLPLPRLQRWLAGHLQSPLFDAIMVRTPPWAPGDHPLLFMPPDPS